MKLTGTAELVVVAALVGLLSFAPKLLGVVVGSPVGRALAFGFVAYLWKQHNELVALLLAVALVKACPAYEYAGKEGDPTMMTTPPASKPKKEDTMGGDKKY